MTVYLVVDIGVDSPDDAGTFREYAQRTNALLARSGVEVVAFDPAPRLVEGEWSPRTVVIQKYPDMAAVQRFYDSDEYAPLKALRQSIGDSRIIAVEGT